ncbi:MAG: hypothetical protein IPH07_24290 [Deltaproteobacteria bacterium]|nr:hypothetical protein [Deltaproteobacteria bacterium]
MTPERATEIELELRRASMDGPIDSRQRIAALGLEALAGWQRARDLTTTTVSTADRWRAEARELRARIAALVVVVRDLGMDSNARSARIKELSDV